MGTTARTSIGADDFAKARVDVYPEIGVSTVEIAGNTWQSRDLTPFQFADALRSLAERVQDRAVDMQAEAERLAAAS